MANSTTLQSWLCHSNNRMDDDTVLLDYKDLVRVRRSDLWRVCEHDGWINDIVMNFCFERHRERARDEQFRRLKGELIDPNVAHFLHHGDILDAAQLLKDLELDGSKLFCLPVNDETDLSLHVGGCHWSLLVHTPAVTADIPARWSHIDSMSHKNIPHAEKMAKQIAKGLLINEGRGSHFLSTAGDGDAGKENNNFEVELFSLEDTPQQKNGHDCGIFVIELACKIVDFGVEWEIDEDFDMHDIDARGWRKETYRDIEFLIVDDGEQFTA
ncbi:unnamed protein product [Bathycoccus prasinos]